MDDEVRTISTCSACVDSPPRPIFKPEFVVDFGFVEALVIRPDFVDALSTFSARAGRFIFFRLAEDRSKKYVPNISISLFEHQ